MQRAGNINMSKSRVLNNNLAQVLQKNISKGNSKTNHVQAEKNHKEMMETLLNIIGEKMLSAAKVDISQGRFIHEKPCSREGAIMHVCNLKKYGNCIIIYGGLGCKVFGNLSILELTNGTWSEVNFSRVYSDVNTYYYYHTAVRFNNNLIMFGGYRETSTTHFPFQVMSNQVTCIELETFKIYNIYAGMAAPPIRKNHIALNLFNNCMLIHGGIGETDEILNDFWMFSLNSKNDSKWKLLRKNTKSIEIEMGTAYHTGVRVPANKHVYKNVEKCVFLFGGFDFERIAMNNLYKCVIDYELVNIVEMEPKGIKPPSRFQHTATFINKCKDFFSKKK